MKGVRGGPEGQRWGVRLGGGTQRRPRDSGRGGGGGATHSDTWKAKIPEPSVAPPHAPPPTSHLLLEQVN